MPLTTAVFLLLCAVCFVSCVVLCCSAVSVPLFLSLAEMLLSSGDRHPLTHTF